MKPYVDVMGDPKVSIVMRQTQKWIENFICTPDPRQQVVGNRKNDSGVAVTPLEFAHNSPAAHVCPFVRDSIAQKYLWIEESPISPARMADIENLLLSQIRLFKLTAPAFDPISSNQAAGHPIYLKTFVTVFPAFAALVSNARSQYPTVIDPLYAKLRSSFMSEGLMLGQFYAGCKIAAVHNPGWNNPGPLIAPYPSFAIRYMAHHDHLFIPQGSPGWPIYKRFFP